MGTSAEGLSPLPAPGRLPRLPRPALSTFLQQLSLGAARRPPDRLQKAGPPPSLAGGGAGLALYVQTPDQPHSGHYVNMKSLSFLARSLRVSAYRGMFN